MILETAEKKLAELIAERDAVREAEALVDRIAEPVTLESEETISAARTAYNGLTVRQKEMYSPDRLTRLEALEAALAEKKKQAAEDAAREEENREKIAAVETLIDAIGTVTKNSGPSITAARTAFDALSETLRARVGNYNVLLAAEAAYKRILTSGDRPTQGGGGVTPGGTITGGNMGVAGSTAGTTGTTGTNPAGETGAGTPERETTVTDVSGKTGGRIETGVTPSENTADTDSGSGLSWLWWVIPLVLGGGIVLWLLLGKKREEDEDEE